MKTTTSLLLFSFLAIILFFGYSYPQSTDFECKISLHRNNGQQRDNFYQGETIVFKLMLRTEGETEVRFTRSTGPLGDIGRGFRLVKDDGKEFVFYGTPFWHYALIESKAKVYNTWSEFTFSFLELDHLIYVRLLEKNKLKDEEAFKERSKLYEDALGIIPPGKYKIYFKLKVDVVKPNLDEVIFTLKANEVILEATPIDLTIKK